MVVFSLNSSPRLAQSIQTDLYAFCNDEEHDGTSAKHGNGLYYGVRPFIWGLSVMKDSVYTGANSQVTDFRGLDAKGDAQATAEHSLEGPVNSLSPPQMRIRLFCTHTL